MRFFDAFSGIGGMHQAMSQLGHDCVGASEIDAECCKVYFDNYSIEPHGDITKITELPEFDILCGGFPCFIKGTQVLSFNGYKNIEDIVLDDKLLTHTGKFQNILNLQQKNYSGSLYEFKLKYHPETIICTPEHPYFIRSKKKVWNNILRKYDISFENPQWKNAKDITKNDYFGMVINTNEIIPEFIFDKIINQHKIEKVSIKLNKPEQWFMMGYFIGDGWIEETKKMDKKRIIYKIRFAINNKDEKEVFNIISKVLNITDKNCNTGKCKKFGCSDFIWYNILKQFGKYASGKKIPEWVQDGPINLIKEFVNGYIKADGYTRNGEINITSVSYNLVTGIQRLFLKC